MQPRTLRTRRGVRRGLLLALAVSATVALALPMPGLAARQDTDPTKWAQGVCSAIVDWSGAAETRANALGKQMSGGGLPQARAVLSRFLDQMVQETDRMITRIDVYGTPGVKNGTPIRQRLRTLMAAARASLAQGRRDAAKLSITDATAFQKGAGRISDSVGKQFDALGKGFDALDKDFPSAELDRAVAKAAACSKL